MYMLLNTSDAVGTHGLMQAASKRLGPRTSTGALPGKVWVQGKLGSQSNSQDTTASPDARWQLDLDLDGASLLVLASARYCFSNC